MRYAKFYSKVINDVSPQQVWALWSNMEKRHLWDDDTEWAKMHGEFKAGNTFIFKIKGGPKLKMSITESTVNKSFTDSFKFPLATLYGIHEMIPTDFGLEIKTTMVTEGLLAWLWQKLVVNKIVQSLPHQTEMLIQEARKVVV